MDTMTNTETPLEIFERELARIHADNAEHYAYVLPTRDSVVRFEDKADMRRKVAASGSHFFDKKTMEFFRSKVVSLIGGRVLITSEQYPYSERHWTVRYFYQGPTIIDAETFASQLDHETASKVARLLAAHLS